MNNVIEKFTEEYKKGTQVSLKGKNTKIKVNQKNTKLEGTLTISQKTIEPSNRRRRNKGAPRIDP